MIKEMILVGVILFLFLVLVISDVVVFVKNFRYGLFWYEIFKKEEEKKVENKYLCFVIFFVDELFKMYLKDVQDLLDKIRDYVLFKLFFDVVFDYYKVQDVVCRKLVVFISLMGYVMLENF